VSWDGYYKHAFGHDSLRPVTNGWEDDRSVLFPRNQPPPPTVMVPDLPSETDGERAPSTLSAPHWSWRSGMLSTRY
jgi:hypothetical protein